MRDVLIHDYLKVNLNRVWRTVEIDLPPLDTVALFRAIGAALLAVEQKIRAHLQQARRHSPPWPAPVR